MAVKVSQELKELYNKVCELEDEMSVTTKNNVYIDDLLKSRRLLLYRYALLLQIKDMRTYRRKVETRIARINTLKGQAARGRMLTKRESEAISKINVDIRKQEEIVESYDNKKEIYSDKRIAYYGMDDDLISIIYKYSYEFEPYFIVNEKNVLELKRQLDESNNIKDNMNETEILSANQERYGDEIVEFELGIILNTKEEIDVNKVDKKLTSVNLTVNDVDKKIKNDLENYARDITEDELSEEIENALDLKASDDKNSSDNETKKYNYFNGYNLYKEDMDEIIFDSIEAEVENDIAMENEKNSDEAQKLLEEDFSKEKEFEDDNFLKDEEENIKDNLESKKIVLTDEEVFKHSATKKNEETIKDKLKLKEKLENYINQFGNDMTREYYNNEIRNTSLEDDEIILDIDNKLYLDIYQLGILFYIDQLISKKKTDGSDPYDIKVLINKLYQLKMEYKLFPGMCFSDTEEFKPEDIIDAIKTYATDANLDATEMFRIANIFTFSASDIKKKYREMYGLNKVIENSEDISNDNEDDEDEELE